MLQTNYPGWNVYVDGIKQDIVEVDGNFMGVKIGEGRHEVRFSFRPIDFMVGATISFLYFCAYIIVLLRESSRIRSTIYRGNQSG